MSTFRAAMVVVLIGLLSGCFGWGSKDNDTVQQSGVETVEDEPKYYIIDVDRGAVSEHVVTHRILRIKPVRVTSHFRGKTLVFRVGNNDYQPQPPHQFFIQPQDMFTDQLRRWLQKSGLFSQVIITDDVPADMILETAVTALYGEQRVGHSPQAVLEMQFFLTPVDKNNLQAVFETGLRIEVNIGQTTPESVVSGWKLGLDELLLTLEDDLSDYFSKRDP